MKIDICPVCGTPAHASETDDAGRHPGCAKVTADTLTDEMVREFLADPRTSSMEIVRHCLVALGVETYDGDMIALGPAEARIRIAAAINARREGSK